jgi:hypothetical protein
LSSLIYIPFFWLSLIFLHVSHPLHLLLLFIFSLPSFDI